MYLILVTLCVLILPLTPAENGDNLGEGSKCLAELGRRKGTCKFLDECPEAQHLRQKFDFGYICSFVDSVPIVCCIPNVIQPTRQDNETIQNGTFDSLATEQKNIITAVLRPGVLSNHFCRRYNNFLLTISDGERPKRHRFAHMAIMDYDGGECLGVLVSDKYILTAAHCLTGLVNGINRESPKRVRLGFYTDRYEDQQNFTLVRVISHPHYRPPEKYADVALLELGRKVNFTEFVFPACLNTGIEFKNLNLSAIVRRDRIIRSVDDNTDLNEIPFHLFEDCLPLLAAVPEEHIPYGVVDDVQICAKSYREYVGSGSSGGPLQIQSWDINCVVGILSFGNPTQLGDLTIFTRVDSYLSWIEMNVWKTEPMLM